MALYHCRIFFIALYKDKILWIAVEAFTEYYTLLGKDEIYMPHKNSCVDTYK